MSNVKNFVKALEEQVRLYIQAEGAEAIRQHYNAPKGLSEDELVDFCVGVEYANAFK